MNCREARQLISPYLDGVLDSKESLLLQGHLNDCRQCEQDYRDQARLSAMLRAAGKDIKPAPPGFKDAVMQAVQGEADRSFGPRLRTLRGKLSWKTAAPAAAAAVLLVFVSLHGLGPDKPPAGDIAIQDGGLYEPAPPDNTAEPIQAEPGEITDNAAPPNDHAPAVRPENPVVIADNPALDIPDPGIVSAPVLLSPEDRNILTTMLVVESELDQGMIADGVRSMAARYGGSVEKLGQQAKDGLSYNLFKITVDRNQNDALLSRLSSWGTVIKRDEDRQDISQAYTQALEQFLGLSTRRGESRDQAEIKQLEQQIASLQKQLNDWKQKAGAATVVLWVQD